MVVLIRQNLLREYDTVTRKNDTELAVFTRYTLTLHLVEVSSVPVPPRLSVCYTVTSYTPL